MSDGRLDFDLVAISGLQVNRPGALTSRNVVPNRGLIDFCETVADVGL